MEHAIWLGRLQSQESDDVDEESDGRQREDAMAVMIYEMDRVIKDGR